MTNKSNISVVSMRLHESDTERFRELTEKAGINQSEFFNSLIDTYELSQKKKELISYQSEIETFERKFNELLQLYTSTLVTRETIKESLQAELKSEIETKQREIEILTNNLSELKLKLENANKEEVQLETYNKELIQKNNDLEQQFKTEQENSLVLKKQLESINLTLEDYRECKDIKKSMENSIETLKNENTELKNENIELKNKLQVSEEQRLFFENQLKELKEFLTAQNNKNIPEKNLPHQKKEKFNKDKLLTLKTPEEQEEYLQSFLDRYNKKAIRDFARENEIKFNEKTPLITVIKLLIEKINITANINNKN